MPTQILGHSPTVEDGRLRVEAKHSCAALSAILKGATAAGVRALMVGPAPVDDPAQNERICALSAAFGDACREASVSFVSVVEPLLASRVWMEEVASGDGAHPAADGYEVLAQLVIAAGWADWLRGT